MTTRTDPIDARLDAATTTVLAEISRTDAKSGVLLTAFSLPLAALVATIPGRRLSGLAAVLTGIGTLGLVAAMLVVLVAVRPRLGGAARGSFLYWSLCTADELRDDLTATTDRAEHVIQLSRIARKKYRGLRAAVDITAASLFALALALLASLR
ncbi:Pycsar system effector family protein [Streptomyces sp. NPDC057496]|uniref:Pycsar system effector family protein n=1 Tax=Streptomyces sp. NPDC057496 TaxID=3346149 RepID=UPI003680A939